MSKKKKLIPFKWLPAAWGLTGNSYKIAKAEYELDGFDLARTIIDINFNNKTDFFEKQLALAKLDRQYDKITDRDFIKASAVCTFKTDEETQLLLLKYDLDQKTISEREYLEKSSKINGKTDEEIELLLLKHDLDQKLISTREYDKQIATLNKQPWVDIIKVNIDPNNPAMVGDIELDWNAYWVIELKKKGYEGLNDDIIVMKWFELLCASIAAEGGLTEFFDKKIIGDETPKAGIREYK